MCNAEKTMNRMDAAGILSEFGASDDVVDLRRVTAEADANLLGWHFWHYKNWEDPTTQSQETGAQGLFENNADLNSMKSDQANRWKVEQPYATLIASCVLQKPPKSTYYHGPTPRRPIWWNRLV